MDYLLVNPKKLDYMEKFVVDFVVDYEQITGTAKILNMHRYLINIHNIIS